MGAPHRRTIYIASLEAHVDRLHATSQYRSVSHSIWKIRTLQRLELENCKGANARSLSHATLYIYNLGFQSMVAGLQNDTSHTKLKMLELERSVRRFVVSWLIPWMLIFKINFRIAACAKLWHRIPHKFDATRSTLLHLRGFITPGTNRYPTNIHSRYLIYLLIVSISVAYKFTFKYNYFTHSWQHKKYHMSIINRCGWARTYPTDPQAASSDLLSSADPSKSFCQITCDQNAHTTCGTYLWRIRQSQQQKMPDLAFKRYQEVIFERLYGLLAMRSGHSTRGIEFVGNYVLIYANQASASWISGSESSLS